MAQHTYALVLSGNSGGQFCQNVFHYQFDDAGFATTKQAADALTIAWRDTGPRAALISILPAAVTLLSLKAALATGSGGFEAFTPLTTGNVGLRGAAMSVSGLSPVIIHYPLNLSLGRGRTFLMGIAEADIEDGIFDNSYTGVVQAAHTNLWKNLTLTGGGGPTATFGYLRRPSKTFVALPDHFLSPNLGTQRRRMSPA